jgi:hypothetical protein
MRWLHSGGEEADSDCGREEAAAGGGLADGDTLQSSQCSVVVGDGSKMVR